MIILRTNPGFIPRSNYAYNTQLKKIAKMWPMGLIGTLKDTKVTVEDGEVNDEEVEEDSGKLKLIDTKVTIDEAYLDDDDVEIKESKYFHFAGMLFDGPERADEGVHDIHLGGVFNSNTVFDFVHSIHFQA